MAHGLMENGQPFKIKNQGSFETFWNSSAMRKIRREMLSGKWPAACQRCEVLEQGGITSTRQHHLKDFGYLTQEFINSTQKDGTAPLKIRFLDLRLGNICNLKCRMCGPKATIHWVKEWNQVHPAEDHIDDEMMSEYKSLNWYESQSLWQNLDQELPHLERIHLAGGEPFLVSETFDVLEKCIDLGRAHEIDLSYNTNLTVLPERLLKAWPKFRSIRLMVSIDAYGELNSFIRAPSKWNVIDTNLRKVDQLIDEIPQLEVIVCPTVQAYNVLHLDTFIEYLDTEFKNIRPNPFLSLLREPPYHSIQILPQVLKDQAVTRLKKLLEKNYRMRDFDASELKSGLEGVLHFLVAEDQTQFLPQFISLTRALDRSRGESFVDLCPEWQDAFNLSIRS